MLLKALSNIKHNGVVYEAGELLHDVSEEAAKLLLEAKVAVLAELNEAAEAEAKQPVPDGFPQRELPILPLAAPAAPAQPVPPAAPANGQPTPEQVAALANSVK